LVDLLSGDYVDFTEKTLTNDTATQDLLYASFSIPGFFSPVNAFGSSFFDGSAIWDIDITAVVNRCQDLGYAESDIIVDVIMVDNRTLPYQNTSEYNSLEMLKRYLEISRYYGTFDGLLRA